MKRLFISLLAIPICAFSDSEACVPLNPDLFRCCEQVYSSHLEFLYWAVAEGGLDYALKMRHTAWSPTTPSYAQGRFENATYDFDPGFRIGLNYFRAPHYWEMKWEYTRFTNRGSNRASKPHADTKYLTGTWPQIMANPLAGAKSRIHFNYNVFDWMIDRVFFPNPHLRLRLLGSGFMAWMDQDWIVTYFDSVPNHTTISNRWNFIGGGLRIGTMFDWYWTGHLFMTALNSFGVLMGSYSNHSKQTATFSPDPSVDASIPLRDTSYKDIRPAFTAQMSLGPSLQKNFASCRIEAFAGIEMNLWFNLQEIYRSTSALPFEAKQTWLSSSVMALYGLTTRLVIDY